MKRIEILHKGNAQTVLTVAADRITIKFKDGLAAEEEERIKSFLLKVADQLENAQYTMRGTYYAPVGKIQMSGGGWHPSFYEHDLA